MMKKLFLSMLAISALAITSCGDDDDNGNPPVIEELNLSGNLTEDRTLSAGNAYVLNGPLFVKSGVTLTIDPGTTITATAGGTDVYLLVERGGTIIADGDPNAPIRFTSNVASPGSWGGVIINGNAIISGQNATGNEAGTEVNTGVLFGGSSDSESSGIMDHVIIEYTGARIDGDAEHNGLTLNGVGSGTTLSNIWIANGDDDGIEFFGGSVNASNIFVLNARDDMFDFSQGYRGTCTNLIGIRENGFNIVTSDPRGIEADGNLDGNSPSDLNQSNFTVEGITIRHEADGVEFADLIKIRRGATGTVNNALCVLSSGATAADFVDLEDSRGNSEAATQVNVTAGANVDATDIKNAPGATVNVQPNNTGANTSAFSWTNYSF